MKYDVGKIVTGKVTGMTNYGIFVVFDDYYSGLIHISEISDSYVRDINEYAKIGDVIDVKIIGIDSKNDHLRLSLKQLENSNKTSCSKKRKIIETTSGFSTLSYKLPIWIEENLKKIKNI